MHSKIGADFVGFLVLIFIILVSLTTGYAESVYIVEPNPKIPQFKSVVPSETNVPKPSCPSGWVPSIFVTPVIFSAYAATTGGNLNVISIVEAKAVDNGNGTWKVYVTVKDNKGNLYSDSFNNARMALVETMCCPAGGDCQ